MTEPQIVMTLLPVVVAVVAMITAVRLSARNRVLAVEVRQVDIQLETLGAERDYWRKRAEQLIDAALARAGAIHQPTMEQASPRDRVTSAAALLTTALSVREIDSSKKKAS